MEIQHGAGGSSAIRVERICDRERTPDAPYAGRFPEIRSFRERTAGADVPGQAGNLSVVRLSVCATTPGECAGFHSGTESHLGVVMANPRNRSCDAVWAIGCQLKKHLVHFPRFPPSR